MKLFALGMLILSGCVAPSLYPNPAAVGAEQARQQAAWQGQQMMQSMDNWQTQQAMRQIWLNQLNAPPRSPDSLW